jgi:hypothetical protein
MTPTPPPDKLAQPSRGPYTAGEALWIEDPAYHTAGGQRYVPLFDRSMSLVALIPCDEGDDEARANVERFLAAGAPKPDTGKAPSVATHVAKFLRDQAAAHIYLTSACCEATDLVDEDCLKAAGLAYGQVGEGGHIIAADRLFPNKEFYPLTPSEARLISEEGFLTGEGYVGLTGYTSVFNRKKYLSPCIEVEWLTADKARHGYKQNDMHAADVVSAYNLALRLAARATGNLERVGGYAYVHETMQSYDDRFTVQLHIPMEWALTRLNTHLEYRSFLIGVMA